MKKKIGTTVAEFGREPGPAETRIAVALEKLGDNWMPNTEFCDLAGVPEANMCRYARKFGAFRAIVRGRVFWSGSKKTIEKIREING